MIQYVNLTLRWILEKILLKLINKKYHMLNTQILPTSIGKYKVDYVFECTGKFNSKISY